MRRSIKSRAQSRSPQNGRQRSSRRSFPIRSRDEHARELSLGIFQRFEKHAHVREIELVRRRLRKLVSERVHAGNRGLIGNRHKERRSSLIKRRALTQ